MTSERPLLLAIAAARSQWPRRVADWTASGVIRADFVQCISYSELCVRLTSSQTHTVLLVDAAAKAPTDDVHKALREHNGVVVVIGHGPSPPWASVTSGLLGPDFDRDDLLGCLAPPPDQRSSHRGAHGGAPGAADAAKPLGLLVAVAGKAGSGVSTTAIALAQGLAGSVRSGRGVLLADLSWRADQALLHDAPDVKPNASDFFDATQGSAPHQDALKTFTFGVPNRGYDLLLGLDRNTDRSAVASGPLALGLADMQTHYGATVLDLDDDFAGAATGRAHSRALTIEQHAAVTADAVVIVGAASLTGLASLLRAVEDLHAYGVAPARIRPVLARIPRRRSELRSAIDNLLAGEAHVATAVRSMERPELDDVHRDAAVMPQHFVDAVMPALCDLVAVVHPTASAWATSP